MLAQFEAWAFNNGADGKPDTPDDIDLGLVDATWSMEEYTATYDDDDIKFVGDDRRGDRACSRRTSTGRTRRGRGSATTSATSGWWRRYTPEPAAASRRRRCGRARICCVTVPLYMRFDPTGGQRQMSHARACASFIRSRRRASRFVYLVPSAAVFALDDCSAAVLDALRRRSARGRRR